MAVRIAPKGANRRAFADLGDRPGFERAAMPIDTPAFYEERASGQSLAKAATSCFGRNLTGRRSRSILVPAKELFELERDEEVRRGGLKALEKCSSRLAYA